MLSMQIGGIPVSVDWENNESVRALEVLCKEKPLSVRMSMYGVFEQVGALGTRLPRADRQTVTRSGDIVLYSGDQIVVFYGSNAWSYTRLGRITDQDTAGMTALLGHGETMITLSCDG